MTQEKLERIATLCKRIAVEQDQDKFTQLVDELNEALDCNDVRLKGESLDPSEAH